MPDQGPEYATMTIAALLVLAIIFAGFWVVFYVQPGHDPRTLWRWFGIAAGIIIVLGCVLFVARGRRRERGDL
ncbi:MAG: hypothetical protein AB7V27_07345 [Candidatus Binatia bacterium]